MVDELRSGSMRFEGEAIPSPVYMACLDQCPCHSSRETVETGRLPPWIASRGGKKSKHNKQYSEEG
jgi:hypothetical protein